MDLYSLRSLAIQPLRLWSPQMAEVSITSGVEQGGDVTSNGTKTRRGFVFPLAFHSRGSFGMCGKEFLVLGVQASDERFNQ
jgi:hypothetical protein